MTGHDEFDRTLASWFEAEAVSPAPAAGLDRVLDATRRRRPRPAWLAGLGSRWIGEADYTGSSSGVGAIPRSGLRWSSVLVVLLILAALLGAAVMVGARLLQPDRPATGQIGHLAYELDGDIFVADWDGRNPVKIADGLPVPDGPSQCGTIFGEGSMWSPDGRHLAYRSDHGGDGCPGTVHVTDSDGREIATFPGTGWRVSWSPDSTRVATWVDDSESLSIGIFGIHDERQAVIGLPPGFAPPGDYDALWSPDGRSLLMKLAPFENGSGTYPIEVWELPVDGGTPQRVPADDPRTNWSAQYSPDLTRVAFNTDGSLVVAQADGSGRRVVATGATHGPYAAALWSPTGDRLAFTWTDAVFDQQTGETSPGTDELRVLDLASGLVTPLVRVDASDSVSLDPIAFSPEGDRLLFSRDEALWSGKTDGSGTDLLVSGTGWGDWQRQQTGS